MKLASLAAAMADALRRRGVGDPAASLAAEVGIAGCRIAFERWIGETDQLRVLAMPNSPQSSGSINVR
jgi:hypothetical protein